MDKTTTNHLVSIVGWGIHGSGFSLSQLQPQSLMLIFGIDLFFFSSFFVLFVQVVTGRTTRTAVTSPVVMAVEWEGGRAAGVAEGGSTGA